MFCKTAIRAICLLAITMASTSLISCKGSTEPDPKTYIVKYQVRDLNGGIVKITHKDESGHLLVTTEFSSDWERSYTFKSGDEVFLEVEITNGGFNNSAAWELNVFLGGNQFEQTGAFGGIGSKATIRRTLP